ncbi:MAG: hypothetical protein ITG07_06670 [Candidimonas sp.]|nr:hypothetical protein [Candidimonas sp.]
MLPEIDPQLSIPLESSPRKGIRARFLDWPVIRAKLRQLLEAPEAISLAQASKDFGLDQKQLYQNANAEVRALVSRYQGQRANSRDDKMQRLQVQVKRLLQERWGAGYSGMSARDIWPLLDQNLKSVRHSFRHIDAAIAANDP